MQGYITTTTMFLWVFESNKKQRGYRYIDILGLKENETVVVNVTTNLDDKVKIQEYP